MVARGTVGAAQLAKKQVGCDLLGLHLLFEGGSQVDSSGSMWGWALEADLGQVFH